ncbi:MAG: hypothetical protein COC06_01560 [Bacteroidales bacterium]|nr:MAG: hypothetical protein COC06_01560 [Bacteroidales bacterium]
MKVNINDKYFHFELKDRVMILYLNSCLFLEKESFTHRNQLLEFLDKINKNDTIKILVISNDHPNFFLNNYKNKWNTIYESEDFEGNILRVFRTYNQILLKLKSMQKVILSVHVRPINAMLLNFSMAADLRFVSRDFYVDNDNNNMVNIPKGGATFIESSLMYVNPVKMLFQSDKLFPTDLYKKHIVDEIFNHEEIMERVLTIATRYSKFDYVEFEAVKIMKYSRLKRLDLALQKENDYLLTCIRKKKNLNK